MSQEGEYTCLFQKGDVQFETFYYLIVLRKYLMLCTWEVVASLSYLFINYTFGDGLLFFCGCSLVKVTKAIFIFHLSQPISRLPWEHRETAVSTSPIRCVAPTQSIAKPYLEDHSKNHTVKGDTLTVSCQVRSAVGVDMKLSVPGKWDDGRMRLTPLSKKEGNVYYASVVIEGATREDEGTYRCDVKDLQHREFNTIYVKVYGKGCDGARWETEVGFVGRRGRTLHQAVRGERQDDHRRKRGGRERPVGDPSGRPP